MAKRSFGQNTWTVPVATSSTNLGPLTTPFPLPSDCYEKLFNFQTPGLLPGHLYTYRTQGCAISTCCPPNLQPYTEVYQWLSTYYSPGVCPLSWRQCAGPTNLQPNSGETVSFCCPSSYLCPADPPLDTDAPWWACQTVDGSITTAIVMDNLFDQSTVSTEILTSTGTYNVAYPIQIRWKEGDVRITVPVTGSVGSTASVSSDTTTASVPMASAASTTNLAAGNSGAGSSSTTSGGGDNGGGGLSNTATIVIGTVIPILTLLAAIPTCYLAIRKIRKRR